MLRKYTPLSAGKEAEAVLAESVRLQWDRMGLALSNGYILKSVKSERVCRDNSFFFFLQKFFH